MTRIAAHSVLARIETLFMTHGQRACNDSGVPHKSVTALQHALQCAQLAEWAHADDTLVAAALLHDIGHFMPTDDRTDPDLRHEERALPWLMSVFPLSVTEPIRLHVAAKRYLASVDPRYAERLTPAAVYDLAVQGGAMDAEEVRRFDALPYGPDAVQLRLWDDLAKHPGKVTPPLGRYLRLLQRLLTERTASKPSPSVIGTL